MSLQCGIVGLPNVGKSTIFNAVTRAAAHIANHPFSTIDPNAGQVAVPDKRLQKLASLVQPQRTLPAFTRFVDIAGLVEGASHGEGLGNRFLAHIRETQAVIQVVRCFADEDVTHVRGQVDPQQDIAIIHTELALADLESLERQLAKMKRVLHTGDRGDRLYWDTGQRILEALNAGKPVRGLAFSPAEQVAVDHFQLLTARPMLYLCNVGEEDISSRSEHAAVVEALAQEEGAALVVICGKIEAELARLEEGEQQEYLESLGLSEPGLDRLVRSAYSLLDLITFFTAGPQEVRAWTVPRGALAPQAAGVIHSDMQRGFIRAEVIAYQDFVDCGSYQAAREAGKIGLEGKQYAIKDGDIVHFRFNV